MTSSVNRTRGASKNRTTLSTVDPLITPVTAPDTKSKTRPPASSSYSNSGKYKR